MQIFKENSNENKKNSVDLAADPILPKDWTVESHIISAPTWNLNISKLAPIKKDGGVFELSGTEDTVPVINMNILKALNPPNEWRKIDGVIYAPGTIVKDIDGNSLRYAIWYEGSENPEAETRYDLPTEYPFVPERARWHRGYINSSNKICYQDLADYPDSLVRVAFL